MIETHWNTRSYDKTLINSMLFHAHQHEPLVFSFQKQRLNPACHINRPRAQVKHLICHLESSAHERTGTRLCPEAQEGGTGRNWDPAAVDTRGRRTEAIMWVCFQLTCESMSCRCSDLMWGHAVEQERAEAWRRLDLCFMCLKYKCEPKPERKSHLFVQSYAFFFSSTLTHIHFFSWNLCWAVDLASSSHPLSSIFTLSRLHFFFL